MAGYSGHFFQGLTQGVQQGFGMAQQVKEMKWKRKERAALKVQQDSLASAIGDVQVKAKQFAENGWTSQEVTDFSAMVHAGGTELQGHFKGYLDGIEKGERDRVESYKELIDEWTENISSMDLSNMQTAYDGFSSQITDPDAKKYLDTNYKMKQTTAKKPGLQPETFISFADCQAAYPDVEPKFIPSQNAFVPGDIIKPDKPKTYEFQAKMMEQDKMLASGEIDLAGWKAMRERLLGGAASTGGFRTTSIPLAEATRTKMADKEEWEGEGGAKEVLTEYGEAGYDESFINREKERWTRERTTERTTDVESTIETLKDMLGGKGTLRAQEEWVIDGTTKTKGEWYKLLYEQYQREIELLGKVGSIEKFKKLVSPEELKKVGWKWDIFTEGIEKGDIETIWQD